MARLKVFRMPVGFHDAYVAAPSQKAAAEAWGADVSVFARREAELVTEPKLTAEPLASPGKVIKRLRGTTAEQIAALGEASDSERPSKPAAARPKKPKPRPSRNKVDEAEQELKEAQVRQAEELNSIKEREAALARERSELEHEQRAERQRLETRIAEAEASYREALRRWRGS